MKLILVRHGQTDSNLSLRFQGQTDGLLNKTGDMQVEYLGKWLYSHNHSVDAIFSSPLARCRQTISPYTWLCKYVGDIVTVNDLQELHYGEWEGKTWKDIPTDIWHSWESDPLSVHIPGGERMMDFARRNQAAFQGIIREYEDTDKTVLVSTHGGNIRSFIRDLLGVPWTNYWSISILNASVTEVVIKRDSISKVVFVGNAGFMPATLTCQNW